MGALRKFASLALSLLFIYSSALPAAASGGQWSAVIRPTVEGGTGTADYSAELFAPVYQTNSSLFFIAPKFRYNPGLNNENEVNVGLGYRQLIMNDAWFVGGNVYFDTMDSPNNNRYNQIGLGLEARSKVFDVFLNGYIPFGTTKHRLNELDLFHLGDRNLERRNGAEEAMPGLDGEVGALIPYISDYMETRAYVGGYWWMSDVGSDIGGVRGRVQINPVPLVTINGSYSYDHVRDSVWRGEAYLNIPFSVTNIFEGKNPFAGIKDAIAFGKGARDARARMTDRVERDRFIQTTEGTEKDAHKVHSMIYVDNTNTSGNEDGSLKHPFSSIANANEYIAVNLGSVSDLPYVYVFAGDSNNGNPYTGGLDFSYPGYVDDSLTSRSGTLWGEDYTLPGLHKGEMPLIDGGEFGVSIDGLGNGTLNVLGMAITNTGWDGIYGTNLYAANIIGNNLTGNNGAGVNLGIRTGATTVDRDLDLVPVYSAPGSTINIIGNTISGNTGDGIYVSNGGEDGKGPGAIVFPAPGSTSTVATVNIMGNTITENEYDGIDINNVATDNVSEMYVNIGDGTAAGANVISGNGYNGIYLVNYGYNYDAYLYANIIGNTISYNCWDSDDDSAGIYAFNYWGDYYTYTGLNIAGNDISNNFDDGIYLYVHAHGYDTNTMEASIAGNTITGNSGNGVYMENYTCVDDPYAYLTADIMGNDISGNGDYGIYAENYADSGFAEMTVNIGDGTASGRNTIMDNGDDGIYLYNDADGDDATMYASIIGNTIGGDILQGNAGDGIYIENYADYYDGYLSAEIHGNTITNNDGDGIHVDNYMYNNGYAEARVNIGNGASGGGNTITGNAGDGIYLYNYSDQTIDEGYEAWMDATILGNTITGNDGDGVYVYNDAYEGVAESDITIGDGTAGGKNTITGNFGDGVYLDNYADDEYANMDGYIYGNTITGNRGQGVHVYNDADSGYADTAVYIGDGTVAGGNDISGNLSTGEEDTGNGIFIDNYAEYDNNEEPDAYVYASILGNTINGNAGDGVFANNEASYNGGDATIDLYIGDGSSGGRNTINGNGIDGVYLDNEAYSSDAYMNADIYGNTINANFGEGIHAYNYDGGGYAETNVNIGDAYAGYGNEIAGNHGDGIYIKNYSSEPLDSAYMYADIYGNTINDNFDNGIHVDNESYYGYAETDVNIGDGSVEGANTITGNHGDGIYIENTSEYDDATVNVDIIGNTITDNVDDGINLANDSYGYDAIMAADIMGNTITGNGDDGIDAYNYQDDDYDDYGYAELTLNVGDGTAEGANTISDNHDAGIYIENDAYYATNEGADAYIDATILGNTISGNYDDGIYVDNYDSGGYAVIDLNVGDGTLLGANAITGNYDDGIDLENYSDYYESDLNVVLLGNTITGNRGDGVYVDNEYWDGDAYFAGKMEGNVVTGNSGYGVFLYNDDSFDMDMGNGDGGVVGESASAGNNSFYGNLGYGDGYSTDIYNDSETYVYAEYNWWGADADPYTNGQIYNDGYDTYVDPWLTSAP